MPKIVDVAKKREHILAAAAVTFARHGYHGTNLQRVAAAAGMGKSSIYHYFSTKEAVRTALADAILRHEAELFERVVASGGAPEERLAALLDAVTALFDEWTKAGPLLVDMFREPRGRRRVRETFATARAALARLIAEGQRKGSFRSGSAEALGAIVLGCLDGLFLQELIEPGSTRKARDGDVLRRVLSDALRGGRRR
jgi:AcrR family transcriptional regulator